MGILVLGFITMNEMYRMVAVTLAGVSIGWSMFYISLVKNKYWKRIEDLD